MKKYVKGKLDKFNDNTWGHKSVKSNFRKIDSKLAQKPKECLEPLILFFFSPFIFSQFYKSLNFFI